MKVVAPILVASVLLGGCAGTSNGPQAPPEPPVEARQPGARAEFPSCKDHLDAIADCLFKTVALVQREPEEGEPMAAFLGQATWQIAAGAAHEACAPLGLTAKSTRLVLGDGSEVAVEKRSDSRDEMADGETVWHITYRFSSPTCPDAAEANIELHMGGPVE